MKPGDRGVASAVDAQESGDGYDHQVERVARGVGVGSAGQGVGRLLGYATNASVAWMYGPALLVFFYLLGVQILGAVAAYVLSMVLGAALGCLPRVFPGKARYEGRELSAAFAPMIVANVTQYSNLWTAVVVLGFFERGPAR